MANVERRIVELQSCEIRTSEDGNGMQFSGYASVFNTPTQIGSFRETVAPTAFTRAVKEGQDVRLLFNHDSNMILGRSGVNMNLSTDAKGLRVQADLPDTTLGRDMAELVRSGIVTQMSFGFSVAQDGDEWRKGEDGVAERTLNDLNLFDVSPVVYPAYDTTTAEVRALAHQIETDSDDPTFSIVETIVTACESLGELVEMNFADEDFELRAYTQAQRDEMAKSGAAMPDGSFPISNAKDLKSAIHLAGHSKTYSADEVKAHIRKRAKALGLTDQLPEGWMESNAGEEATETRVGAMLSSENKSRVRAAMQHLQDLMDAADSTDALDPTNDGASYNSSQMDINRRTLEILEASL